jgi:hypothetical protein
MRPEEEIRVIWEKAVLSYLKLESLFENFFGKPEENLENLCFGNL